MPQTTIEATNIGAFSQLTTNGTTSYDAMSDVDDNTYIYSLSTTSSPGISSFVHGSLPSAAKKIAPPVIINWRGSWATAANNGAVFFYNGGGAANRLQGSTIALTSTATDYTESFSVAPDGAGGTTAWTVSLVNSIQFGYCGFTPGSGRSRCHKMNFTVTWRTNGGLIEFALATLLASLLPLGSLALATPQQLERVVRMESGGIHSLSVEESVSLLAELKDSRFPTIYVA